jgi:hypothetical protein
LLPLFRQKNQWRVVGGVVRPRAAEAIGNIRDTVCAINGANSSACAAANDATVDAVEKAAAICIAEGN